VWRHVSLGWNSKWRPVGEVQEVDKNAEFRSDILPHFLRFVNMWFILHWGIFIWYFLAAKIFKREIIWSRTFCFEANLSSKTVSWLTFRGPLHSEAEPLWPKNRRFDREYTWLLVCGISVLQCSWFVSSIPSKCKEWLCGKNSHVSDYVSFHLCRTTVYI